LSQQNHILNILSNVIKNFFQTENIAITLTTTANDIEEWDSLNHMNLIRAIEEEFKIEFDFFEIMDFENIGELVRSIQQKM
tara:strand:+ start:500 stop:742 length:243 start_codon:yes stop_codon:yes gene_type:complete